jgi:hypothetical protein
LWSVSKQGLLRETNESTCPHFGRKKVGLEHSSSEMNQSVSCKVRQKGDCI